VTQAAPTLERRSPMLHIGRQPVPARLRHRRHGGNCPGPCVSQATSCATYRAVCTFDVGHGVHRGPHELGRHRHPTTRAAAAQAATVPVLPGQTNGTIRPILPGANGRWAWPAVRPTVASTSWSSTRTRRTPSPRRFALVSRTVRQPRSAHSTARRSCQATCPVTRRSKSRTPRHRWDPARSPTRSRPTR
jgi:hypothetical protein